LGPKRRRECATARWRVRKKDSDELATNRFDFGNGLVLEGRMQVIDWGWGADTHIIPVSAGFYFEEQPGQGKAILMETYGITRIDRVETSGGVLSFVREDTTGPGCASLGGITEGTRHTFRLYLQISRRGS
jgi:hypothetical protein